MLHKPTTVFNKFWLHTTKAAIAQGRFYRGRIASWLRLKSLSLPPVQDRASIFLPRGSLAMTVRRETQFQFLQCLLARFHTLTTVSGDNWICLSQASRLQDSCGESRGESNAGQTAHSRKPSPQLTYWSDMVARHIRSLVELEHPDWRIWSLPKSCPLSRYCNTPQSHRNEGGPRHACPTQRANQMLLR